ncbi:hypothetical protein DTO271G3_5893 [Paecilomyces variotii]|nr:hypothetical protein DTO271G3_5893 [Paecilomyces variotii]
MTENVSPNGIDTLKRNPPGSGEAGRSDLRQGVVEFQSSEDEACCSLSPVHPAIWHPVDDDARDNIKTRISVSGLAESRLTLYHHAGIVVSFRFFVWLLRDFTAIGAVRCGSLKTLPNSL